MQIVGLILIIAVVWTLFCLLLALVRKFWRHLRHRKAVDFWEDFWWLWLEALNPLNYL
ncbi:hypothetical protein [Lacticaseibacillus sp. GG6-2]